MTGSFQRMIDLAGVLAKVRPALEWLHILETPKKRHRLRIAILVCGFAAAAVVLTRLCRGPRRSTVATVTGREPAAAPAQEETDKEPEPTAAALGR